VPERKVLRRCREIASDGAEVRCVARLFHRLAAETWESPPADPSEVEGLLYQVSSSFSLHVLFQQ